MENEIMNNEEVMETVATEVSENKSAMIPVLIGAGLACAGFALYKFGRKAWEKIRSRKEQAEIEVGSDKAVVSEIKPRVK